MFELPVQREEDVVFVYIPSQYVPSEIKERVFEPKKLLKPYEYVTKTYVYGGGGSIRMGIWIPRTGISGDIKEAIPTNMRITHIFRDNRWRKIMEEPLLHPVRWTGRRWRASIPANIREKYLVQPYETVRIVYTEYITEFIPAFTGRLHIYHHGRIYYVQLDREGGAVWVLPKESFCCPVLMTGFEMGIASNAQFETAMEHGTLVAEFVFSKIGGKAVARRNQLAYRSMVVKNYSSVKIDKSDYPELMELRCSYLSACPVEYYLPFKTTMETALEMTVNNMLNFFIPGLKTGYNKGRKILEQTQLEKYIKMAKTRVQDAMINMGYAGIVVEETTGVISPLDTEKSRIEYNKIAPFDFYTAEKYIRIKKGTLEYEYFNDDIDKIVNNKILNDGSIVYVDKQRFIWKTKVR